MVAVLVGLVAVGLGVSVGVLEGVAVGFGVLLLVCSGVVEARLFEGLTTA